MSEEAAVIAVPSVIEDLLSQRLIDCLLVSILTLVRNIDASFINLESIMGPERVIEGECPALLRCKLSDDCTLVFLER